ncbi:MAG: flagellar biosynthetic protein FliO [Alphaproteobacteria bacterium]
MELISDERLIIVMIFMLLLVGAAWVLRLKAPQMRGSMQAHRRLKLIETLSLSPRARASLLEVDGQVFLIVQGADGACDTVSITRATTAPEGHQTEMLT